MGMSTHVEGIVLPGEKWKMMKAVWDSCKIAKITPPMEVVEFFTHCAPDQRGVLLDLQKDGCATVYNVEGRQGYEVDLDKIHADVSIIRFYNAY